MAAPGGTKLPQNGALNHKFTTQQGIQFPKQKKKKKVNPITAPPPPQPTQPPTGTKKKKKKKSKPAEVQQAPPSTKKKVSFSPGVVSTVNFTYSKQEYDRTPIMGIFNHFCNCCQTPIEGARFHCQLCPDFDLCQGCFVDKGARHVHGQQAFTCPELDELDELEDEGDEGEDIDFFKQFFTVGAEGEEPMFGAFGEEEEGDEPMFAGFGEEEEGDEPVFGGFGEEEGDEADLPPACALADENGPLERITPEEAARLTVEAKAEPASLEDLFPKLPASPSQPPKPTKPAQASQPSKPKQPKQPSKPSQSSQPSQPKPSQSKPAQPQPAQPASESSTKPKKHKKKKNKESPTQPAQPSQKQTKQTPNIAPKGQNDSKPVNVTKKSSPSKPSPVKPKAAQPAATGQTTDGGSKKRPRSEESNSSKQKIQRLSSQ